MAASVFEEVRELQHVLRLRTHVLGIQFHKEKAKEQDPRILSPAHAMAPCQTFGLCRTSGKTIRLTAETTMGSAADAPWGNCASIFGLADPLEIIMNGEMLGHGCFKDPYTAAQAQKAIRRIPSGTIKEIVIGPADGGIFEPDVLMVYGTPGQIMQLMNGLCYQDYAPVEMRFVGESSCSDGVVTCYLDKKPAGTIPCYGERQRGGVEDGEIVLAMLPESLGPALEGIRSWQELGNSYPVIPLGSQCDPMSEPAVNVYKALE